MKIVVDTNIAFSALLNTSSNIGQIFLLPKTRLNFYSTEKLSFEIQQHRDKLIKLSGYSENELDRMIRLITKRIRFININLISQATYNRAELLTADIDIDDCEFVALTDFIKGRLWSGDKKLIKGLTNKNWKKFIGTDELYRIAAKSR